MTRFTKMVSAARFQHGGVVCRSTVAYLEQLAQPCNDTAPDELAEVESRRTDRCGVGTAHAVDPLHDKNASAAQVTTHPWDLDLWVVEEVAVEVLSNHEFLAPRSIYFHVCSPINALKFCLATT